MMLHAEPSIPNQASITHSSYAKKVYLSGIQEKYIQTRYQYILDEQTIQTWNYEMIQLLLDNESITKNNQNDNNIFLSITALFDYVNTPITNRACFRIKAHMIDLLRNELLWINETISLILIDMNDLISRDRKSHRKAGSSSELKQADAYMKGLKYRQAQVSEH
jgi:hypothetical protein